MAGLRDAAEAATGAAAAVALDEAADEDDAD